MENNTVDHKTEQDLYNDIKQDPKWMGIRKYGEHRGISMSAVQDQIKKYLLTVENGALKETKNGKKIRVWIHAEKADAIWNDKVKVSAKNMHSNHTGLEAKSKDGMIQGPSYAQSRSIKEAFAARLAQLDYEKKSGALCRAEDVTKAARQTARLTRDYLLNIPSKLSPILAAETDINEVHKLLEDEIHNALTNLSNGEVF